MRNAAQCVGRVLRGKTDWGAHGVRRQSLKLYAISYPILLTIFSPFSLSDLPGLTNEPSFPAGLTNISLKLHRISPQTWQ